MQCKSLWIKASDKCKCKYSTQTMSIRAGLWPGDISSCLGRKITGGCRTQVFYLLFCWKCAHRALLHPYIIVCENRKLLSILFQYGDVFPTEGRVLFLRSCSHLSGPVTNDTLNPRVPPLGPHFRDVMQL